LESLESDRIISRDSNRDVYYFGHDLLKDWVLYRILKQNQEDLTSYLFEIRQPLGLYRSIRLLGIALLEENESPNLWIDLIRQVEQQTELSGRWEQALLAAPINSPRSIELLEKVESFLFSENAKYLIKLMIILRTIEVEPNFSYLNALEKTNYSSSERMNILLRDPIPRWKIWQPFMKWILPRLTTLPKNARTEAIRLMEMWQLKISIGSIYRQEIAEIAFSWLQEKKGGF
ncbi:hypothetical protein, partial [Spirulina sp. 06S082]|uniref:hypothetical protein n=1 Tax=Spirulina sp. 06S082 TaxID=3110248 RepID=UPI002B1EA058